MKLIVIFFAILAVTNLAHGQDQQEPRASVAELRQDFTSLYEGLKAAHADLFVNRSEEEYQRKFDEIESQMSEDLSELHIKMLFQEFVAFGRIAHASIEFLDEEFSKYRDKGGKAFPIFVRIKSDVWRVTEDYSGHGIQPGTRITHIDGGPVEEVFAQIWRYLSADNEEIASSLLEYKLPQYLWLLEHTKTEAKTYFTITLQNDESTETLKVSTISREQLQTRIDNQAQDEVAEEQPLRDYKTLTDKIGYLKPGPFYNVEDQSDLWNNTGFIQFIDEAFEHFLDENINELIVDVRKNPGGTNSFSDPMIAWYADKPFKFASEFIVRSSKQAQESNQRRIENSSIEVDSASTQLAKSYLNHPYGTTFQFPLDEAEPRRGTKFAGNVYVMIDRHSYSNAASVAAITQDYGFGTVIGQATTDFATTYASMETFDLPNTGVRVGFPKAHIIRPSGDTKAGPVIPDIELESIEQAVEMIRKSSNY